MSRAHHCVFLLLLLSVGLAASSASASQPTSQTSGSATQSSRSLLGSKRAGTDNDGGPASAACADGGGCPCQMDIWTCTCAVGGSTWQCPGGTTCKQTSNCTYASSGCGLFGWYACDGACCTFDWICYCPFCDFCYGCDRR